MQDHWRNYVLPRRETFKSLSSDELKARAVIPGVTDMYSFREAEMARDELEERGDAR